ncbi:MAG TPA: hypothetical protein VFC19_49935 [Candidatus Limnocylindrales bacterium]|nr:hypothetical protein [Candidatus Limnocylindrales bacterium]
MTTISGAAAPTRPADRFLRVALRVDSLASGLTALAFLGTPKVSKDLFGFSPEFTVPTGVFLLVFAAGVWLAASPRTLNAKAVIAVIALNIAWVVASVVTLATGVLPLTALGVGYAVVQAIAVAALAELEYMGLRKIGR